MSIYPSPNYTQPLSIFNPANYGDDGTTITKAYLDANYLKYPVAQAGTETLNTAIVNGTLTANSSTTLNGAVSIPNNDMFVRNIRIGYGTGTGVNNVIVGDNCGINNSTGSFNVFLGSNSGLGNTTGTKNTFLGSFSGRLNTSGGFNTAVGQDAGNNNVSGNRNTFLGREAGFRCLGSDNICIGNESDCSGNLTNSMAIGSGVKATTSNTIVLGASTQTTQIAGPVVLNSNNSLTMNAGTGSIQQPLVVGDTSTKNNFRLSDFGYNGNNASGTAVKFDFYDNFAGRGLSIMPDAGQGNFGSTTRLNDCVLFSRAQNSGAITISNWNDNLRNGLRVFTTDSSNCGLTLQCGQNLTNDWTEFRMSYTRTGGVNTTTTTFNNVINFNPTGGGALPLAVTGARRQLIGLGTLSFTDISGNNSTNGSAVSRIWTDSSLVGGLNGMYYDCGINGGFHQFSARDGAGNISTPIYYGASLTSVSNTFVVRNPTITSNRFDIVGDTSQNTFIRARTSTNSTDGKININCDSVSAGGVITNNNILNINNSVLETKRPIQITYPSTATPNNNSQLGFVNYGPTYAQASPTASASVRNYTDFDITDIGTFIIQLTISLVGSGNHTLTDCRFAMNNTTATLPTSSPYNRSFVSDIGRTLSTTTTNYLTSTLPIQISSTTKIYINYVLNWSGGGTANLNINVSLTRVG